MKLKYRCYVCGDGPLYDCTCRLEVQHLDVPKRCPFENKTAEWEEEPDD